MAGAFDIEMFENFVECDADRAIDDDAHRAVFVVFAKIGHTMREDTLGQRWHRNQEVILKTLKCCFHSLIIGAFPRELKIHGKNFALLRRGQTVLVETPGTDNFEHIDLFAHLRRKRIEWGSELYDADRGLVEQLVA